MENLLNINQVAFILKVHPLTVRRYIKEGKLKAVKIAGNVRVKETELQNFNSKEIDSTPKVTHSSPFKAIRKAAKVFTEADPFLRLYGRGASLHTEETK